MPDKSKFIALTFDDGPNMSTTLDIYGVLSSFKIKATFFLCGSNINSKTGLVLKHAISSGYEIGNHSMNHKDLQNLSDKEILDEISDTDRRICEITGTSTRFFRAPYIHVTQHIFDIVDKVFIEGLACNDWLDNVSGEERARIILDRVKEGDIILMHDTEGNKKTVEALKILIPSLLERGYSFCTLSELFSYYEVEPKTHTGFNYSNAMQKE